MDTTWLNLAIVASEQNDLRRARELLRGYVRYHSKDEQGWLWLSRVAESSAEKSWAIKRAQALNPNGAVATIPSVPAISRVGSSAIARKTLSPAPAKNKSAIIPRMIAQPRRLPRLAAFARVAILAIAALLFIVVAIAVVPMFVGNRTLVVLSGSMEPAISKGAVVIAQPVPSKSLRVGDVIIFSPNAEAQVPVIHRIFNIREKNGALYYTTKGDANNAPDPAEISLPATAWTVNLSLPGIGYIISFASSPMGIVFLIVLPILAMLALSAREWLKKDGSALSAST
ncbi:MAG: signal peptidase I [Chloroflexi bacterium]|nr:signal peptidase I [Chloroflexota bacterium]